eukprot:SAG11_NODE_5071_length_1673_cov_1.629606_2_plen_153_part_00
MHHESQQLLAGLSELHASVWRAIRQSMVPTGQVERRAAGGEKRPASNAFAALQLLRRQLAEHVLSLHTETTERDESNPTVMKIGMRIRPINVAGMPLSEYISSYIWRCGHKVLRTVSRAMSASRCFGTAACSAGTASKPYKPSFDRQRTEKM